ncbi:MAG: phosphoribosyltransferase family protein [Anaerolineae bacterium]
MTTPYETYSVTVAGVHRDLRLFEVAPGVRIAIVNILGDTELTQASAKALGPMILERKPEVIVTAEAKSIPLAHELSAQTKLPYVVLRKSYKPYMGEALQSETLSITTGAPQTLYLDEKDRQLVENKRVVLVDDVISTGSTLQGMRLIMNKAMGHVVGEAAIFTEGERSQWTNVIALGHLPVWVEKK